MRHTSGFIFSLLLLCFCPCLAQQARSADTVTPIKQRYGIRLGADLYRLSRNFWDDRYRGFEITGDYRLTKKYYLAAELGNEDKTTEEDQLTFTTKGSYIRLGFDYNAHQNWLDLENMVYVGLRYGFAAFSQKLDSYKVYNPNPYFDEGGEIAAGNEYSGLSAHWGEVVAGIKTRVFDNVFVGFSFRMSRLFAHKEPNGFENLYIPGYNKVYSGEFGVGMNYTVSYFIPLYKKENKAKKDENEKPKK